MSDCAVVHVPVGQHQLLIRIKLTNKKSLSNRLVGPCFSKQSFALIIHCWEKPRRQANCIINPEKWKKITRNTGGLTITKCSQFFNCSFIWAATKLKHHRTPFRLSQSLCSMILRVQTQRLELTNLCKLWCSRPRWKNDQWNQAFSHIQRHMATWGGGLKMDGLIDYNLIPLHST